MYEKVERLMQEKGVKASDVAKAIGISSSVFTDWKKGRYTPKADKLYAIAQYFGVPMEYFFDEDALIDKIQSNLKTILKRSLSIVSQPETDATTANMPMKL